MKRGAQVFIGEPVFIGWQDCSGIIPDFELWNIEAVEAGRTSIATVSRATLEKHGIFAPPAPVAAPNREVAHA
jgi:hypothetical protein